MTGWSILAVDDNVDVLSLLEMVLSGEGHRVRKVTSGVAALAALGTERFDVILLDVMMPGMSGLELLRRLRADVATQSTPVIMLTARIYDDDLLEGYASGADYYIPKPFNTAQLLYGLELILRAGRPA